MAIGVVMVLRVSPVWVRQPSSTSGRYWIFLSLRLTTQTEWSAAAKSVSDRLSSDHTPSVGFRSGAQEGRRTTRSQSLFASMNSTNSCVLRTLRLSQTHTNGALSRWWVARIRSRYSLQVKPRRSPLRPRHSRGR